jgi:hypothetical protein
MNTLLDDRDERQTRVDRMIDEFREAQSRRLARSNTIKRGDDVAESKRDVHVDPAVVRSTPSH